MDIILIIWLHYVGDFLLQTDWMALNKSHNMMALSCHCMFYAIPFLVLNPEYALLMGLLHFPVDFVTSKICFHLYSLNKRGLFFKVIGLDQAIHLTVLLTVLFIFYK